MCIATVKQFRTHSDFAEITPSSSIKSQSTFYQPSLALLSLCYILVLTFLENEGLLYFIGLTVETLVIM